MRPLLLLTAALGLACATARAPAPEPATPPSATPVLRAAELARVRCLLVAPFENASDAPLAADAATSALLGSVDAARTRIYPLADLRALFHDTPLELPEGLSPALAVELAELLGADAALYGSVEGRARGGDEPLLVNVRLALAPHRDLVFAASVRVALRPGEQADAAVRRTLLDATRPVLDRLGDRGRRRCFDPERTKALRGLAVAEARAALPPPPAPTPAVAERSAAPRGVTRSPRQAEWARRLSAASRFVAEEVTFGGRTAQLQRDAGLADLALALAASPDVKARLEAFVDSTSDPEGDAKLSAAMAQTAVSRLVELGVARERLSWAGRGGESPLLPNFTARGRAANRRLEIVGLR
jgi:outer membrane protein OmpA-like peptidoglycan-associated protein